MDSFVFSGEVIAAKMFGGDEAVKELYAQHPELAKLYEEKIAKVVEQNRKESAEFEAKFPNWDRPAKGIDIPGTLPIGSIQDYNGHQYRVISHFTLTAKDIAEMEDINDVYMDAGSYSHAELVD